MSKKRISKKKDKRIKKPAPELDVGATITLPESPLPRPPADLNERRVVIDWSAFVKGQDDNNFQEVVQGLFVRKMTGLSTAASVRTARDCVSMARDLFKVLSESRAEDGSYLIYMKED